MTRSFVVVFCRFVAVCTFMCVHVVNYSKLY